MAALLSGASESAVHCDDPDLSVHVAKSYHKLDKWLTENGWNGPGCKRYVEVSLAYCPRTATARLCSPPRADDHVYSDLRPDEIGGTADLVIVNGEQGMGGWGPVLVLDHKTGMWGDFSRPENLAQLWVLGTAACLYWGRQNFIPAVLHSPRDGVPIVYEGEAVACGGSPLMAGLNTNRIRKAIDRIGDGSMRPGPWCARCPVRTQCPTQHAELLSKAGELVEKANLIGSELVLVNPSANLSREEKIGRLHLLMARFRELDEAAVREMKRALADDPSLEPIRPDGKLLSLKTRKVERISKASIVRALGEVEGQKVIAQLRECGALEEKEEVVLWAK